MNAIFYTRTPDGSFVPVTNPPSTPFPAEPSKAHVPDPRSIPEDLWDGWLDGIFIATLIGMSISNLKASRFIGQIRLLVEIVKEMNMHPLGRRGRKQQGANINNELVPYVGSLSLTERAQVSNWFEANISRDKKKRHIWLGRLPIAHAYTIYISTLLKVDPEYATLGNRELISKAWNVQFSGTPSVLQDVDVDRDCLETLEEEMFEKSAYAGIADHWQWGLDSGDHQY